MLARHFSGKTFISRRPVNGAAMVETVIVFPIMMLIGMGIVHLGLIYQAKTNLEYASFMGARQAASTELASLPDDGDPDSCDGLCEIKKTVRCRMSAHDPLPEGVACDAGDLPATEMAKVLIQIIRPSANEFNGWGEIGGNSCGFAEDNCSIPNENLIAADPGDKRGASAKSIQSANIMTISVRYLVDTKVPFMNGFFIGETAPTNMEDINPNTFVDDPFNVHRNRPGVWITAESTMMMQSRATVTSVNRCAFNGYC